MSKPIKWANGYYCSRCKLSVPTGAIRCRCCNEEQDWHPSYSRQWGGFWEIRHNCTFKKITEAEYIAVLKAEEEYYEQA